MASYALYLLWGSLIGFFSGLVGIGGGVLIIPSLTMLFGLSQHQAQGTSLAMMVPPIGLLAAWRYWKGGNVIIPIALLGALGFFCGGYFGATAAHHFTEATLKRVFGILLIGLGIRMLVY
jgi:hypothetical protein